MRFRGRQAGKQIDSAKPLLQATQETLTLYKAMELLTNSGQIAAAWYMLEESERPIGAFKVDIVPIVPLGSGGSVQFFPKPPAARRIRRYKSKRPRVGDRAAGAGAEQAGQAEEDGDGIDGAGSEVDAEDENQEGDLGALLADAEGALLELMVPHEGEEEAPAGNAAPAPAPKVAPAPAPPPPVRGVAARGIGGMAAATAVLRHGKISYYHTKGGQFEAVCRNPNHGKCVLTRKAHARPTAEGMVPKGGRPLGFLAAWLERGDVPDKASHWAPEVMRASREARLSGRNLIKEAHHGPELLAFERPKVAELDEASEPEDLKPYYA